MKNATDCKANFIIEIIIFKEKQGWTLMKSPRVIGGSCIRNRAAGQGQCSTFIIK
jgi:hypothetical protein